jgi:hypothetical protein
MPIGTSKGAGGGKNVFTMINSDKRNRSHYTHTQDLMRFYITWMEKASIGNRWRRLVPVAGNVTVN